MGFYEKKNILLQDHKLIVKKNQWLWVLEQKTYVLHEQSIDIA